MRALVTGASGFIGGAVARALLDDGAEVRALVREGSRPNVDARELELFRGDLRDADAVRRATEGCDAVFHVGALYALDADAKTILDINVGGTKNVLDAALACGVSRVVHTSSVSTLAFTKDGRSADETRDADPAHLAGPYKRSKVESEQLVRAYAKRGLDVVIVNPTFPIGARDVKPTPTGKVIADFLAGKLPAFVDTGMNVVDVDDVAKGHLLAFRLGRAGERYVLGHRNMTMRELLETTARLVQRAPPRVRLPHALAMAMGFVDYGVERVLLRRAPRIPLEGVRLARRPMYADPSRAVRELGLPQTPIETALSKAVRWFQEQV